MYLPAALSTVSMTSTLKQCESTAPTHSLFTHNHLQQWRMALYMSSCVEGVRIGLSVWHT